MDPTEKTIRITAEIPESLFKRLAALAERRGVSANAVLERALQTEIYLAQKELAGGSLLIEETPGGEIKKVKRSGLW